MTLDMLKKMYPIFGNYFPDVLLKMYVVNVSYMGKMLYRTAEMFIHEVTRKKINVFSKEKEEIKKAMLKEMDIGVIPDIYGGNCETHFDK